MNRNVAIVGLLVANLVLMTAVIFTATSPPAAYGQVAASGAYVMVTGQIDRERDALYVIDLRHQRMGVLAITGQVNNLRFQAVANQDLRSDFQPR